MVMEIGILCTIYTNPVPVLECRIILEYRKTLYSWKWERKKISIKVENKAYNKREKNLVH